MIVGGATGLHRASPRRAPDTAVAGAQDAIGDNDT
jgi:hypothetical protein